MLVHRPKTWPMMKIILMEVRELLLLKPPHQNHSPNQPPNRSQSPNPKERQKSRWRFKNQDYLTSTKRIRVRWHQTLIDRDRSEGQVRGLNPDRVQARYDDSLRAPPPDCIDDLLLVPGVRMFCPILFRLSNSLGSQPLTQSMGWRSEMLNRRLGFSKSWKD